MEQNRIRITTGLPGQERAARCRPTTPLTGIHRQKVTNGYAKERWATFSQKQRLMHLGLQIVLPSSLGFIGQRLRRSNGPFEQTPQIPNCSP